MLHGYLSRVRGNCDKERLKDLLKKADEHMDYLTNRYENALSGVCEFQDKIKSLTSELDNLEEILDLERSERGSCERNKSELEIEWRTVRDNCNEQEVETQKQTEINKKLLIDIQKLERDLEEKRIGLKSGGFWTLGLYRHNFHWV